MEAPVPKANVVAGLASNSTTRVADDSETSVAESLSASVRLWRLRSLAPRASVVGPRARIGIDVIGIHLASSPRPRARVDDVRALARGRYGGR